MATLHEILDFYDLVEHNAQDGTIIRAQVYTEIKRADFCVVLVHGAGYTGTCWNPFLRLLQKNSPKVLIISIHLRGHGISEGDCSQMSLGNLVKDSLLFQKYSEHLPTLIIGHSLGGAVAAHLAHKWNNCIGVALLDITEESALISVGSMESFLKNRPNGFSSLEEAAKWMFKTAHPSIHHLETIDYQLEKGNDGLYYWKIPLLDSKAFWREWFVGMNKAFLGASLPLKILILAGSNDQLDKDLMMGQMQGQFQLVTLPNSSHAVMLDEPEKLSKIISGNLERFSAIFAKSDKKCEP
jgi:protein phosphatase methylesterase 1